jgi:hypothetical protein
MNFIKLLVLQKILWFIFCHSRPALRKGFGGRAGAFASASE